VQEKVLPPCAVLAKQLYIFAGSNPGVMHIEPATHPCCSCNHHGMLRSVPKPTTLPTPFVGGLEEAAVDSLQQ
jgi:hypothetical protein